MNPQNWFRLSGSLASALLLILFSSMYPVRIADAQTAGSSAPGSTSSVNTRSPFIVAPSFPLAGAPAGVAMGDLNQDGKLDLVTTDTVSGKVTVFLGLGNGKFASGVEYSTGSHPGAVAVGDINGDGHMEVIVGDEVKGTISVLTANLTGTLQRKQSIAASIDPAFLATGDFNGDGKTDLVVASRTGGSLAVLLNDGKGNLQNAVLSKLLKAPESITVADFNNDGHADVALANADGTATILLGSGEGKFRALPNISIASGSLSSIVSGDFNRDGNADLAVTQSGNKTASVLLGKGDGSFEKAADYAVGNHPIFALVTDLTGSGFTDLIAINQGSNTFSVLSGNGDGTFKNSVDFVVGKDPLAAVAGDFDADGRMDLAVINSSSQSVSVALGNGDGTFKASRSYTAGMQPRALASADLNGDKIPDLVVTNYCGSDASCSKGGSVAVFLGNAEHNYELANSYALGAGTVAVALVDVNGDKFPDIVALNREDKSVSILLGKGDGSFEQPITVSVAESPIAVVVGDFNKDGEPDLAVLGDCGGAKCAQPGSLEILFGHGTGFTTSAVYPVGFSPTSLVAGDLNGDKNLDIVVANSCGTDASCKSPGTATVLLGSATGKFKAVADVAVGNSPSSIALGDLSGRGVLDLLSSSSSDNTVAVLTGKGDGTFAAPKAYKVGNSPGSVVVADFNGDGKPDVAVANVQDSTVSVLFGKGDGTLFSAVALPVGMGPDALTAVSAVNGSHASLATANGNSSSSTPGTEFTLLPNGNPDPGTGATTVTISQPTPATPTVGVALALTVVVSPVAPLTTVPTGSVTFLNGGTAVSDCGTAGVVTLDGTGTAQCSSSVLTAAKGSLSLTATYAGDPNYAVNLTSNSLPLTVTYAPAITVGFATGTPSSVSYGTSVTFVASVLEATGQSVPTGSIVFKDGETFPVSSTTCPTETLVAGATSSSTQCAIPALAGGTHIPVAVYTPDAASSSTYQGASQQSASSITVNAVAPTVSVALTTGNSPSPYGTSVTFTATVAGVTGGTAPTGTIDFFDSATKICSASSLTAGTTSSTATCANMALLPGSHTISATYNPATTETNYLTASSSGASNDSFTVSKVTPSVTVALTTGSSPSTYGVSVTFTATVPGTTGLAVPTGTVNFLDGATTLSCSPVTVSAGATSSTAACTTQTLTPGSHNITAVYNPATTDTNYNTDTSATAAQLSVSAVPATISFSSSPSPSTVDQSVTITATVVPSTSIPSTPPNGSVSFTINGATNADCPNPVVVNASAKANCVTGSLVAPTDLIAATYAGDSNYTVTGTQSTTLSVTKSTPVVTVSTPTTPSVVNQPVTFTAAVKPPTGAGLGSEIIPGGSVTFTQGATTLCASAGLSGNPATATCNYAFPASIASPGVAITATYNSDTNFNTAAGNTSTPQIVGAATTATAITSSAPNPSNVGQSVTFTATLTPQFAGTTIPAGSVVFTDTTAGVVICTETVNSNGTIPVCVFSFTAPGAHVVEAQFNPSNGNFVTSSGQITQTVNSSGTAVSLTASPASPSTVNQQVTFSSAVTSTTGATTTPQGSVVYTDTSTGATLCTVTLNTTTGAVPNCQVSNLIAGTHPVVAAFTTSNTNYQSASSNVLSYNVNAGTTTIGASSTNGTPTVDQPVTYTATITPQIAGSLNPTGSVTFTYIGSGGQVTLCSQAVSTTTATPITTSASCTAPFTASGSFTVTATYTSGNGNYTAGTPATVSEKVTATSTSTSIPTVSPSSSVTEQPVTLSATVKSSVTDSGLTLPTGTITFSDTTSAPSVLLCTANVTAATGVASCGSAFATVGTRTISAVYSGDTNFATSTSPNGSQVVSPAGTTASITQGSPNPSNVNQQVSFTATLAAVAPGVGLPKSGTMAFVDTSTTPAATLCAAAAYSNSTNSATCPFIFTSQGTHTVTATFSSTDSNYSSSSASSPYSQVVNSTTTSVSLSANPTTSTVNQTVTFTSGVTSTTAGNALPQGTVVYNDNFTVPATALCTVTLTSAGAVPNCVVPLPAAGTHPIVAVFTPSNTNFESGSSTALNFIVSPGTTTVALTPSTTSPTVDQVVTYNTVITPGIAGATNPAGTVTITYSPSGTPVILCSSAISTTTTSPIVTSASCSAPFPASGTFLVHATYASGNGNFIAGADSTATEKVSATNTTVKVSSISPATSTVNQVVAFTATVASTISDTNLTLPTGSVVFSDSSAAHPATLCTATVTTATGIATCSGAFANVGTGTRSVTAVYSGDANFATSTSSAASQTVTAASTVTAVTQGSPNPSDVNQSVVFTSTVTGVPAGVATPQSGTMTLFDTSSATPTNPICTTAVANGIVPACPYPFPTSGNHTISATFTSSDPNFSSSSASPTYTQMVNTTGTVVSLTSSPAASAVDETVNFTATVTSANSGAAIPQGAVTFTDNFNSPGTVLCTETLTAAGTVPVCPAVLLLPGVHPVVAAFVSSNASFGNANSSNLLQLVNKGVPTLALSLSPAPSTVDQLVTFTATLTNPFPGATVPTKTVTFSYAPNGTTVNLCTANVNSAGTSASCSAPFVATTAPATPYTVTATYSGDNNFAAGTPVSQTQTVNPTGTSVAITQISSAPTVNQTITFTATVSSNVTDAGLTLPSGTVTFSDTTANPNLVLCKTTVNQATGVASCTGAFGTIGVRTFSAVYSGDTNFSTSNSASITPAVTAANTTSAITLSSVNPSTVNQAVVFTATVTSVPFGTVVPKAGTMAFVDTSTQPATTMCTEPVTNGVVATCTFAFTSTGAHAITATFTSQDTNFNASQASPSFTQTVNATSTSVALSTTASGTVFVNQPVVFNAVVTSATAGTAIPQGTVAFIDTLTGLTLCTETLTSAGTVPSCTAPLQTSGTHTIVASFTPTTTDFSAAKSPTLNQTIAQAVPTLALTGPSSTTNVTVDEPVTFTATFTPTPALTANPLGTVTYPTGTATFSYVLNGVSTNVCNTPGNVKPSATGGSSTATCTAPFLNASNATTTNGVIVTYSGDSNFTTGTQATIPQTVNVTGTSVAITSLAPATSVVNQPVTFSAAVTSLVTDTGLTLPSGTVTFSDTTSGTPVPLCTSTLATNSTVPSCVASLGTAGVHTITATYSGDNNFSGSTSASASQTVTVTGTTITVSSSLPISVATEAVTFTAVVTPTTIGTTAPTGTIVFSSSDHSPNNCGKVPVSSPGKGLATASCLFPFLGSSSGPITVTATYVSGDSNFASGNGTTTQTVQNFAVAFSPSSTVTLSQGYSNTSDPFNPTTISVNSTPGSAYTDKLNVSCQVQNSSGSVVSDPSCAINPTTLSGSGASPIPFTVTASSAAPVDQYTVILTATDVTFPSLSQQATLKVDVVNTSGTLSLAPGSSATQSVAFDTAPPPGGTLAATLDKFSCGNIVTVAATGGGTITASELTCAGPSSSVPISGNSTTVAITVTVNGTSTTAEVSKPQGSGAVTAAAFWGVPFLALLAWFGHRKSPRRNFFRFLGTFLLLIVGLTHVIGCGGSFTRPPVVTGGPPVGSYLVQVIAVDSNGVSHFAIVPLVVN